jgi:hypothetical protein
MTIPTDKAIADKAVALSPLLYGARAGFIQGAEWTRDKMLSEIVTLQKLVRECQELIHAQEKRIEELEEKVNEANLMKGLHTPQL